MINFAYIHMGLCLTKYTIRTWRRISVAKLCFRFVLINNINGQGSVEMWRGRNENHKDKESCYSRYSLIPIKNIGCALLIIIIYAIYRNLKSMKFNFDFFHSIIHHSHKCMSEKQSNEMRNWKKVLDKVFKKKRNNQENQICMTKHG